MTFETVIHLLTLALVAGVLYRQEAIRMATEAQFQAAFERVNTATSAIAVLIRTLIDERTAGGLTSVQEDEQLAKLTLIADALEQMAQDPAEPVPVQPPA